MYSLDDVMTPSEAADKWGLKRNTIIVAIRNKRFDDEFIKNTIKRSGNSYIITRIAMINIFGQPKEE